MNRVAQEDLKASRCVLIGLWALETVILLFKAHY